MENPIQMDDLGVPLFLETPVYRGIYFWELSDGNLIIATNLPPVGWSVTPNDDGLVRWESQQNSRNPLKMV